MKKQQHKPRQAGFFDAEPPKLSPLEAEGLKKNARAFAGAKPARTNRDPALIKRKRKPL